MASAEEYLRQVRALGFDKKRTFEVNTSAEAKSLLANIRQWQKELRHIKKNINLEMKAIRARYTQQKSSAGSGGSTLMNLMGKRRAAGRWRAESNRQLTAQRDRELGPYEQIKTMIDSLLLEMDRVKLQIEQQIAREASK